jgi:methylthioribose-1-phosphate isomerase
VFSPIRWTDGALELLDQTRLPAEEVWLRCETPEQVADAIKRLAVRGAPAIGVAAAYGLALAMRAGRSEPPEERLDQVCELLGDTRPTAVNLHRTLERARRSVAERPGLDHAAVAELLLDLARELHREEDDVDRAIAAYGAALLDSGERVLTHCNTGPLATGGYGTAGGVIQAAWAAGKLREVWVTETRPLLQGSRLTAWELERAGIPFRLVTDASVGTLLARGLVDRVVVGADRIAANGDVANKIGTYPTAVLARRHGVPFYVAAPRSTIDPGTPSGEDVPIEERDPAEVRTVLGVPVAPAAAPASNWAFDVTPHELVSGIVTEVGVLAPPYDEAIARALER